MAVVELKDDSQASRLPLVEDGVVGFGSAEAKGRPSERLERTA